MQIPYNIVSGLEYQGFNINELLARGYTSPEWGTFLQWREKGFKVKKGEHGAHIRTFVQVTPKKKGDSDMAPRHYVVFNQEQVEEIIKE